MDLLAVLEKAGPVLFLELLLAQNKLDLTVSVVDLAVLGVDLAEQVQGDGVCDTLAGGAGERNIVAGELEFGLLLGDIRSLEAHVEVVALGLISRGALCPGN